MPQVVHIVKCDSKDLRMLDSRRSLTLDGDVKGNTTLIAECGCDSDCSLPRR